jgi:Fe-S oxidoreductase
MRSAHVGIWWFHLVIVYVGFAWAPYTKMAHVLTAPLNIYFSNLDGYGSSLKTIDFETAETFGVGSLGDFTWKDRLDFDACTECGRCTAVCPANTVGKALSPRDLILDLRSLMLTADGGEEKVPIVDESTAVSREALWQCTTCAACMEACPVFIEQMPKIVDARRFLVMEEAEFPEELQAVVTSLEQRGHPFPGTSFNRVEWADGLDIPELADMADPSEAEVLLWVGCSGALVERNQSTVRATAQLLQRAGVKFAILGREETCNGDPARRIGNEFLFEMLAKANVESLAKYGVKKIVTSCPHCFNTFANEYPALDGTYEVFHHSEFLERLVEDGSLKPSPRDDRRVTFHDPCYLGRHNGIFDAPRSLVKLTTGSAPTEMEQSREKSFCCGGGGGMCYTDEPPDQRVNQERADQALATDADVVAVGCPFCTTMLEDGINARRGDRVVEVRDVAELLWESVDGAT